MAGKYDKRLGAYRDSDLSEGDTLPEDLIIPATGIKWYAEDGVTLYRAVLTAAGALKTTDITPVDVEPEAGNPFSPLFFQRTTYS